MKARFFLLGLCALALAACSIDEVSQVNDTNAISFKATATRATAATTNTIDGFTVWAWETIGDATTTFMDGVQAVRASEGSSTYTTAHTYYWPGAALDFYAFIPAATAFDTESTTGYDAFFGEEVDLTGDLIETAEGATYDTYTGYVANATITSPDAISFNVHVPADAAKEIDLGYAATLGQSAGTVGLNFRHALSQVAFKAQNGNADWTVDIQGVTLCGIFKEGTYTLPEFGEDGTTAHNATEAERGEWTIEETAVQGRFNAGIAATTLDGTSSASQSITAENGALMLIPQTVAEWDPVTDPTNTLLGAYVRINCQVIENDTGEQIWPNYHELDENTSEPLEYAEITVPFDVDWEEGKLYTYTIVFGEGLGYYAPDDPETDLDGTPVLIPIRFTVDIDDFGNTDEVDEDTTTDLSYIKVESAAELVGAVRMGYQAIEIAESITLTGYLEFNSDCTLTIDENCTLTGPDATADCYIDHSGTTGTYTSIIYVNGCNLTIEGEGTVATGGTSTSDYTDAIWVVNGTVTVYGGTYKGSNWSGDTSSNYIKQAVYCGEGGYAYIYGGDFYSGKSTHPSAYAGTDGYAWVLNCHNSSWEAGHAMIYCYGGTYHDGFDPANLHVDDAPSYVAVGYWSLYDEKTDSYTVSAVPTDTEPLSVSTATNLRDAVAAGASAITVSKGDEESLDLTLLGYLEFNSDCTLTIDENVTITCPNANGGENGIDHNGDGGTTYSAAIYVNGCNLTIEGSGTVETDGTTDAFFTNAIWVVNGTVTVKGGTYYGGSWNTDETTADATTTKHAVYCGDNGYAYIYDGTFSAGISNHSGGGTEHRWVLNLHDASYKEGKAMIWCYGGKYYGFDPSNPKTDDAESYVAEGYTVTYDSGTDYYTVVPE